MNQNSSLREVPQFVSGVLTANSAHPRRQHQYKFWDVTSAGVKKDVNDWYGRPSIVIAIPARRMRQGQLRAGHTIRPNDSDRQRKLISKIDAAIQRIDDNTYGYCEETGEPISLKRLEARPIATLSVEAQERHEKREKVYRDE